MDLQARELGFSYRKGDPVIRGLDLDLHAGRMYGLSGPSGRGKSTLLYLLGLLARPRKGAVIMDGIVASDLADHERADIRATKIGFLFQDALLNPARSILDNVLEGVSYMRAEPGAFVDAAKTGIERVGVTVPVSRRPGEISGGQAQRVALVRALLKRPELILADEPTGNLDVASASTVIGELEEAARERSALCVIASHDRTILERCDEVITL